MDIHETARHEVQVMSNTPDYRGITEVFPSGNYSPFSSRKPGEGRWTPAFVGMARSNVRHSLDSREPTGGRIAGAGRVAGRVSSYHISTIDVGRPDPVRVAETLRAIVGSPGSAQDLSQAA